MIYALIFIFLLISIYYYDYRKCKFRKNELYVILCVIFVITMGFRYRIGNDTVQYEYYYYHLIPNLIGLIKANIFNFRFEPGFMLIASIIKTVSPNDFTLFQLVFAAFINIVIFRFIYKNTNNLFLALLLYYFHSYIYFNAEIIRQATAICFFLLAWPYFVNRKWFKYYSLCLIALSMHYSAIICFILPILYLKSIRRFFEINKYFYFLLLAVIILTIFNSIFLLDYVYQLNMVGLLSDKMEAYSGRILDESSVNISHLITGLIKNVLYPLGAFLTCQLRNKKSGQLQFILCLNAILGMAAVGIDMIFRLCSYLLPFVFIVIANWSFNPVRILKKVFRLSYISWVLILLPMFVSPVTGMLVSHEGTQFLSYMRYYPYKSVFFPEKDKLREAYYVYINS